MTGQLLFCYSPMTHGARYEGQTHWLSMLGCTNAEPHQRWAAPTQPKMLSSNRDQDPSYRHTVQLHLVVIETARIGGRIGHPWSSGVQIITEQHVCQFLGLLFNWRATLLSLLRRSFGFNWVNLDRWESCGHRSWFAWAVFDQKFFWTTMCCFRQSLKNAGNCWPFWLVLLVRIFCVYKPCHR